MNLYGSPERQDKLNQVIYFQVKSERNNLFSPLVFTNEKQTVEKLTENCADGETNKGITLT